jgi:hypothetical protein
MSLMLFGRCRNVARGSRLLPVMTETLTRELVHERLCNLLLLLYYTLSYRAT